MKKIFAFICLIVTFFALTNKKDIEDIVNLNDSDVYVILKEVPKKEDILKVNIKEDIEKYKDSLKGITIRQEPNKKKAYGFLNQLSAEIVKINTKGDFIEILAYSEKLKEKKKIGDNIINIQMILKKDETVIGIPVIFDCY